MARQIRQSFETRDQVRSSGGMSSAIFTLNRALFASRAAIVEVIETHLDSGAIFQIQDSSTFRGVSACYEIWSDGAALRLLNAQGRQIGVYASIEVLIDHAEAVRLDS